MNKKRILLVDDHPVVLQGLAQIIDAEKDFKVCGKYLKSDEALDAISRDQPDCTIVDMVLGHASGMDLLKSIKSEYPGLPVLILSMHGEFIYAERALRAGASGYVIKSEAPDVILAAIRQVLQGKLYVSSSIADKLIIKMFGSKESGSQNIIDELSDREFQAFRLIGQGLNNREIAELMNISIRTVDTYRTKIKEKCCFSNSSELIKYAFHWVSEHEKPK